MSHLAMSLTLPANISRDALRLSTGIILAISLLAVIGVNLYFPRSLPADPAARALLLQQADLPQQAETVLQNMVRSDPLNLDLNYRYINNHFSIPTRARHDEEINAYYEDLTARPSSADVGHYGKGLIAAQSKDYRRALDEYFRVVNKDQKYLNNSIGRVYLLLGDNAKAETYLQREVENGGNVGGAAQNLTVMYMQQNRFDRIRDLMQDPRTGEYVSAGTRRYVAFRTGDLLSYALLTFFSPFSDISVLAVFSALLICGMWFLFFWRIDIYEQEPLSVMAGALALGAIAAPASRLLSDTLWLVVPSGINPNALEQMIYSILNIGVVEEASKFIPVLVIAIWSKQINEPVDLLIYGGLSALGFATVENSLYFSSYGLGIVFGRFLTATIMHLAMTGFICYMWARARYLKQGNTWLAILVGIALAAVIHGLYDYFILGELELSIVSVALMIAMAWAYGRMITNLLNSSPLLDEKRIAPDRLMNYNLLASTGIFMLLIAFLYNNFNYSTEIADSRLLPLGWATAIAALVILRGVGALRLRRARGGQTGTGGENQQQVVRGIGLTRTQLVALPVIFLLPAAYCVLVGIAAFSANSGCGSCDALSRLVAPFVVLVGLTWFAFGGFIVVKIRRGQAVRQG